MSQRYLREWKSELDERPESVKKTAQGKIETATYKQTKSHIKGLFKQLKTRVKTIVVFNKKTNFCYSRSRTKS